MGLQSLDIRDFRNIQSATLSFSPGLNLISGENAAGKSSLLEAIYCLGRVRSFRTAIAEQPIRYGQPAYRLVGRVEAEGGRSIPIGIERRSSGLEVHLDGQPIRRLSDLAGRFPVQAMSSDTPTILNGGPRYRRQALDWALFHVEQGYREVWQRYARVLRQRNAALRAQALAAEVHAWDSELLEAATRMDTCRREYIEALQPYLAAEVEQLLPDVGVTLRYQAGWSADSPLADVLAAALEKDRARGYTRNGPHRADFSLLVDGRGAAAHCSRGQQKALTVGFLLAQVRLQQVLAAPTGAFLLDDLASELDSGHRQRVLTALRELDTQVFVTAIEAADIDPGGWQAVKRFHVEHGRIQEMV